MFVEPTKNIMEKNQTFSAMDEAKRIQAMIRVLPNEAGAFNIEDLEAIFSQEPKNA